ncbi:MAG: hypothetical protein PF630_03050 [Gammaproteobacteria bacterium]|jgi:hypothetical protein|nr:hypothetical protein [Gammaproteobacteria bacterium]
MNMQENKVENGLPASEKTVRPLARLLAKELTVEEITLITAGNHNCGKCSGATNDPSSDGGDADYLK